MQPKVSVIIPTYNVEDYIDECISSILNQTYTNFEIVICDDCSTDETVVRLQKYASLPNVTILSNKENLKQATTRNKCINACKGEYVLIQDADDISESDRMEVLVNSLEEDIDFVGSSCYCFNPLDGKFENLIMKNEYPMAKDLLWGIPFVHASILFRKVCLTNIGGYRSTKYTKRCEDYDLIMRLYAAGYRGKNIKNVLYGYRVDDKTISRRSFDTRLDECVIRYEGFKGNNILLPLGWIYIFKPILAHFYQMIKYRNLL